MVDVDFSPRTRAPVPATCWRTPGSDSHWLAEFRGARPVLRFNPDGRMGWLCWHVAPRRQGRHEGRWNTDGEVLARSCCDQSCADVPKLSASRSRPPVPPRGLADEPCIRLSGG